MNDFQNNENTHHKHKSIRALAHGQELQIILYENVEFCIQSNFNFVSCLLVA